MKDIEQRYPIFVKANAAFTARLVRAVKTKELSAKTATELTDLHVRALGALTAELEAMIERARAKSD